MKHITSTENPFFKQLLKLATSTRHRNTESQTLLDGAHLLASYLASGKKPLHITINAAAKQDAEITSLLKLMPEVPITQLADALFAKLSQLKTASGILSLIAIPQAEISPGENRFCLLLEDIQDPGNMGSMLRSAAAAGCDAIYMSSGCADAWSPKVLRAAMGGHFVLNLHENIDLLSLGQEFKGTIFAASLTADIVLYACDFTGSIGFAIGNEGAGLSPGLLEISRPVLIPMPGGVESLNAAAATAVCLFEAVRQRSIK